MKRLSALVLASATVAISASSYGAAYRPALIHQVFPYGEVENYLQDKARENSIEMPKEVLAYLSRRLKGEKVTGVGVTLSSDIGNLFSGQKFPFELTYLSEMGQARTQYYETLLDWEKLNEPHAYTLIFTALLGTERTFFDGKRNIELEHGYQTSFPLPNGALSVTEVSTHVKDSTGRVVMWCISLGSHSASNFLKSGTIAHLQNS